MSTTVCPFCDELVLPSDFQLEIARVKIDGEGPIPPLPPWAMFESAHEECLFHSLMGGIEHLTAPPDHETGSCYENTTLTYRESGRAALRWYNSGQREAQA